MGVFERWKGFLGRGENKYKGPEAEMRLMGVRSRKRPAWLDRSGQGGASRCDLSQQRPHRKQMVHCQ